MLKKGLIFRIKTLIAYSSIRFKTMIGAERHFPNCKIVWEILWFTIMRFFLRSLFFFCLMTQLCLEIWYDSLVHTRSFEFLLQKFLKLTQLQSMISLYTKILLNSFWYVFDFTNQPLLEISMSYGTTWKASSHYMSHF